MTRMFIMKAISQALGEQPGLAQAEIIGIIQLTMRQLVGILLLIVPQPGPGPDMSARVLLLMVGNIRKIYPHSFIYFSCSEYFTLGAKRVKITLTVGDRE